MSHTTPPSCFMKATQLQTLPVGNILPWSWGHWTSFWLELINWKKTYVPLRSNCCSVSPHFLSSNKKLFYIFHFLSIWVIFFTVTLGSYTHLQVQHYYFSYMYLLIHSYHSLYTSLISPSMFSWSFFQHHTYFTFCRQMKGSCVHIPLTKAALFFKL